MTDQDDRKDDDDDRDQSRKRRKCNRLGVGCQSSLSRMTMINLRMELSAIHQGKLSIGQVENALNKFESQGWLSSAPAPANNVNSSSSSSQRTPTRRRRRNFGIAGASYLQLGPRAYMEFPDFLIKVGMDRDHLPQALLHG